MRNRKPFTWAVPFPKCSSFDTFFFRCAYATRSGNRRGGVCTFSPIALMGEG